MLGTLLPDLIMKLPKMKAGLLLALVKDTQVRSSREQAILTFTLASLQHWVPGIVQMSDTTSICSLCHVWCYSHQMHETATGLGVVVVERAPWDISGRDSPIK